MSKGRWKPETVQKFRRPGMTLCRKCHVWKANRKMSPQKAAKNGIQTMCKRCKHRADRQHLSPRQRQRDAVRAIRRSRARVRALEDLRLRYPEEFTGLYRAHFAALAGLAIVGEQTVERHHRVVALVDEQACEEEATC